MKRNGVEYIEGSETPTSQPAGLGMYVYQYDGSSDPVVTAGDTVKISFA